MLLGFPWTDVAIVVAVSLTICITVCALAMEAAVLFVPSFLFLFPYITANFPALTPNAAIGLALVIEAFGYTSSVLGYWYRRQIRWSIVGAAVALTIPLALGLRIVSYLIYPGVLMIMFGLLLLSLSILLFNAYRTGVQAEESSMSSRAFDRADRIVVVAAGAAAGLVGIAIGEMMNTLLFLRKRLPLRQSVATSAAILHLTIFSATLLNLILLAWRPSELHTEAIVIPWNVAAFIIPTVIVGGQIGAYLNNRLPQFAIHYALVSVYGLVGLFVLGQALGNI